MSKGSAWGGSVAGASLALLLALAIFVDRPAPRGARVARAAAEADAPSAPAVDPVGPAEAAERARPGPKPAAARALDRVAAPISAAPAGGPASYVMRDGNASAFFTPRGVAFSLLGQALPGGPRSGRRGWGLHWGVAGAREVEPRPEGELPGRVNSFKGHPSQWKADQKSYSRMVYDEIRPGLDMVVESRRHGVKYTLNADRASDVKALRLRYEGALEVRVIEDGAALEAVTDAGTLREDGLRCTQSGRPVAARYVALGGNEYGIALPDADPALPLEVDPVIGWSSYLGGTQSPGTGYDYGNAIAVDASGNVYVVGETQAADFPSAGGFDAALGGGSDVFVAKVNAAGNSLAWSSYLGGSSTDYGQSVAVDGSGNVYVAGNTYSTDFFTTAGAFDTSYSNGDLFVTKINAAGSTIAWSTFLGGSSSEYYGIVRVDAGGNVYVSGYTYSNDFPVLGGFDTAAATMPDVFVSKLNPGGTALVWSSYLGGISTDVVYGMALDSSNNVYLTGYTYSTDFPTTGGYDTTHNGGSDVFLTKVNAAGSTLAWSTFLGGSGYDQGWAVAVDGTANVYVTGQTSPGSPNIFPTTLGAYDTVANAQDAFVAKFNPSGASLAWSTFLGGSSSDYAYGVAVDGSGNVYVAGVTYSSTGPPSGILFPTTVGAFDTTFSATPESYVAKLNASGTGLVYSTLLGGNSTDYVRGLALDGSGFAYVTGYTYSSDYPVSGGFDMTYGGGASDAFVTKVNIGGSNLAWSSFLGGANGPGDDYGRGLAVDSAGNAYVIGTTYSIDFPVTGGAFDPVLNGGNDITVTKVAPSGTTLVWSTYLGGSFYEEPTGIAIDAAGSVYVCGSTDSTDFPVTPFAYDIVWNSGDGFVTKLSSDGSALVWSSFIGGTFSSDYPQDIAVDAAGAVYITGQTYSTDFPTTVGAFDTVVAATPEAFATKFFPDGSGLQYSTLLGGFGSDYGWAIAVDASGNAYVGGTTYGTDYPTTVGVFQPLAPGPAGNGNAFVTKLNAFGSALVWSSYLGGGEYEEIRDLRVDAAGNVYVIGVTYYNPSFPPSPLFPTTAGAYDPTPNQWGEVFVTKFSPDGSSLVWSTYLGGTQDDYAEAMEIDAFGNVYVTGNTFSFDFPLKGAFDATYNGGYDVFVTKIKASGADLSWSSFLGGTSDEYAYGIGRDSTGAVYVAGQTYSGDFPTTAGVFDPGLSGNADGFVTRLDNSNPNVPIFLSQLKQNGITVLAVGDWTNEPNIIVRATCGDSDDDPVRLEVEIKPIDVFFNGSGTTLSAFFAAGTQISLLAPLPGGTPRYHWRVRSADINGNTSLWNAFGTNGDFPPAGMDVGKDTTGPSVAISSPTAASTYTTANSPIALSGSAGDDLAGVVSVAWANSAGGSGPATFSPPASWSIPSVALAAGVNNITVTATDRAGNPGSDILSVTYDTTPPTVTIETPTLAPTYLTGSASVTLGGSSGDNFQVASVSWANDRGGSGLASLAGSQPNPTWSASIPLAPGVNNVTVTATDGAGNVNAVVESIAVTYDNVPPSVVITSPTPPSFTTQATSITVSGTASDANGIPAGGVTWTTSGAVVPASGTATGTTAWSATINLAPGANLITVTAQDTVGNLNGATITIYRDNADPAVTITVPTSAPTYTTGSASITLGGDASDDIAVASVSVFNATTTTTTPATLSGPPNSPTWSAAGVGLAVGPNSITVTVTDSVGRTGTDAITITYDTTSPALVVSAPPTATFVTSAASLTVAGTASDNVSVTSVTVTNLTTGVSSPVTASPALPTLSTSWNTTSPVNLVIGNNIVRVIASDGSLSTTVDLTIIHDPYPPAVTITGPTGAAAYVSGTATISLSGVASDNRGVTEVSWSNSATGGSGLATLSGPATSPSWTVATVGLSGAATNVITVTAKDEAGTTTADTLSVTYDATVPAVTITDPTSAPTFTTTAATLNVGGSAGDNVSVAGVSWTNAGTGQTGTAAGTTSWSVTAMPLALGANVITAVASDAAGNTVSDTITVYRDSGPPGVTITSPTSGISFSTTAATIGLGGTASDDVAVASVSWVSVGPVTTRSGSAAGTSNWSVASIALDPGDNAITVTATDGAGQSSVDTLNVSYDPTAPGLAIADPASSPFSTTTTPVSLAGTASDNIAVTAVSWVNSATGGSGSAAGTASWSASAPLTSGSNLITVTAQDAAGNLTSLSITVIYDPASPLVAITSPTTGATFTTGNTPITISGTASDDVGVASVTWASDQPVVPPSGAATGTTSWSAAVPLAPGPNEITITATDGVGRTGTTRITIILDPTPPQVQITNPTAEASFNTTTSSIGIGGIASDNLTVQNVTWANAANGASGAASGTGSWTVAAVALVPGSNVITVTATDGVGNTGTGTLDVIYDGTAPAVSITGPTALPTYSTNVRPLALGGTATDNLQVAEVSWANSLGGSGPATLAGPVTSRTWSASVPLFSGDNVITVTAVDGHGQTATDTLTVTFTPESVLPTLTITTPTSADTATTAATPLTVGGTADDNFGVVSVAWQNVTTRVRGAAAMGTPPPAASTSFTADVPLTDGPNVVVFTATDDAGNTATDTITVTFTAPADTTDPAVTITLPTTLDSYSSSASPLGFTFDATDDVGVSSVRWVNSATGGDGYASPGAGTTWTTSVALAQGFNIITVTATDPMGNTATDSITVNFTPPPGDAIPPAVAITTPTSGTTLTWTVSPLALGGTGSDNVAMATVVFSNSATLATGTVEGTGPWTASISLVVGVNVITVRAYDTSGNFTTTSQTVTYAPPPPPPETLASGHCGSVGLDLLWPLGLVWLLRRRRR